MLSPPCSSLSKSCYRVEVRETGDLLLLCVVSEHRDRREGSPVLGREFNTIVAGNAAQPGRVRGLFSQPH